MYVFFSYGPPVPIYGPLYEVPHAMLGFFDKLKFKIDLFTIGKILLKLVIFKKIVSLIAILCLLLFIPSLKHHKEEQNENISAEDVIMMRKHYDAISGMLLFCGHYKNLFKNMICCYFRGTKFKQCGFVCVECH